MTLGGDALPICEQPTGADLKDRICAPSFGEYPLTLLLILTGLTFVTYLCLQRLLFVPRTFWLVLGLIH